MKSMLQESSWKTLSLTNLDLPTKTKNNKAITITSRRQLKNSEKKSGEKESSSKNLSSTSPTTMNSKKINFRKTTSSIFRIMCSRKRHKTTFPLIWEKMVKSQLGNSSICKIPICRFKISNRKWIWEFLKNQTKAMTQANQNKKKEKTRGASSIPWLKFFSKTGKNISRQKEKFHPTRGTT